ncbi:MAG: outer membrane beta-barrel protein [Granulosicoccus sp.]
MRWLIATMLLVTSSFAVADGPVYAELQLGAGGVRHSDLDFYPVFGSVTLGAYVAPNIGIEVFADSGISADEDDGFEMDIEEAYGVGLRLQSPPIKGVRGYIVLGAVDYTLNQEAKGANAVDAKTVNEEFTGMRVSVGLMQRFKRLPGLLFTTEYRHYNADEPLRVDAIVIGLRVNAP